MNTCDNCKKTKRGVKEHILIINKLASTGFLVSRKMIGYICKRCSNKPNGSKYSRGVHNVEAKLYNQDLKDCETCDGYDSENGEPYWF